VLSCIVALGVKQIVYHYLFDHILPVIFELLSFSESISVLDHKEIPLDTKICDNNNKKTRVGFTVGSFSTE